MRRLSSIGLGLFIGLHALLPTIASAEEEQDITFSRLIIYDVRGSRRDETAIILEQKKRIVTVWLKNYLGQRRGEMPYEEYRACFESMRRIRKFALKKKYRGRLLRTRAATGMITLAWQDSEGKQIRTIKYFAPEHTLDDFRGAFNRIWGLSRYAVLSVNSFESPCIEYIEDAVYSLSGSGWMTLQELQSAINFHIERGRGKRIARAVWGALDQQYSRVSQFRSRSYLEYCVKKGMILLGPPALAFLEPRTYSPSSRRGILQQEIILEINKQQLKNIHH
jgi:hypothetical protein